MSGYILVIDDQERILQVVEDATRGASVHAVLCTGFVAAKRRLIQSPPNLIISATELKTDPSNGGYKFCHELKQHGELSRIPILLISDALTADSIRLARENGANGLIAWPITVELLRGRIAPLIPELVETTRPVAPQPLVPTQPPQPSEGVETSTKLQLAQRLLAQVLHNLRTSDLLQIVDLDDVPRVVTEITRKVCGISDSEGSKSSGAASDTFVDLEQAFGMKKP